MFWQAIINNFISPPQPSFVNNNSHINKVRSIFVCFRICFVYLADFLTKKNMANSLPPAPELLSDLVGGGGRCGKIRTHAISRKALTLCAKSADPPSVHFSESPQARSGYHDPRYHCILYTLDEWPKPHSLIIVVRLLACGQ